jgi:cell wall-associated NlpC family hydrolase
MPAGAIGSKRRPRRLRAVAISVGLVVAAVGSAQASHATSPARSRHAAALDDANLRLAANAVEGEALRGGALSRAISSSSPAVVLLRSDEALIKLARKRDPAREPVDTRAFMGQVPYHLTHEMRRRPRHFDITATHTLRRFSHSVQVAGSAGIGTQARKGGATAARFQKPDGVYVDPRLPVLDHPTVGEVALRAALGRLGQPYVWAGAGPTTFDCSGLVGWAYARAGIVLTHFSGDQWNEGRLIPSRDALPGDLILFGRPISHVAMYLGAGWMLNAPYTGHYVDVVPVGAVPLGSKVAGVVRP